MTITSGPAGGSTSSASVSFTFASSQNGSTFRCSLDGAGFSSCASPASYSGLADGVHTFGVEAINNGLTGPPASVSWTVSASAVGSIGFDCSAVFGSFGVGSWPAGCWRPYSDTSAFNRAIPASPPLMVNSAAIVSQVLGYGPMEDLDVGVSNGDANGWPTYYSQSGDPLYTIHCTESWGTCAIEGAQIRIPAGARPEGPTDAHMTIVDQSTGWEYDLWQVTRDPISGGGALNVSWGGKLQIAGDGRNSSGNAANTGLLGGIIRAEEMQVGQINHALFMFVYCDSGSEVYPATGPGRPCSDVGMSNSTAPPEGARFWLAMSDAQIQALNEPAWKKTILTAMAHYGLIVGDTGGTWGLKKESGRTYSSFGQTDKWVTLSQQWGLSYYAPDDDYVWRLQDSTINSLFAQYLRVVDPCVSQGTC